MFFGHISSIAGRSLITTYCTTMVASQKYYSATKYVLNHSSKSRNICIKTLGCVFSIVISPKICLCNIFSHLLNTQCLHWCYFQRGLTIMSRISWLCAADVIGNFHFNPLGGALEVNKPTMHGFWIRKLSILFFSVRKYNRYFYQNYGHQKESR